MSMSKLEEAIQMSPEEERLEQEILRTENLPQLFALCTRPDTIQSEARRRPFYFSAAGMHIHSLLKPYLTQIIETSKAKPVDALLTEYPKIRVAILEDMQMCITFLLLCTHIEEPLDVIEALLQCDTYADLAPIINANAFMYGSDLADVFVKNDPELTYLEELQVRLKKCQNIQPLIAEVKKKIPEHHEMLQRGKAFQTLPRPLEQMLNTRIGKQ